MARSEDFLDGNSKTTAQSIDYGNVNCTCTYNRTAGKQMQTEVMLWYTRDPSRRRAAILAQMYFRTRDHSGKHHPPSNGPIEGARK